MDNIRTAMQTMEKKLEVMEEKRLVLEHGLKLTKRALALIWNME